MIGSRRHIGLGSTPTYHTVNRLTVPEVGMRVNRKDFFHQIMAQGQWVVKKLDFKIGDSVTLRCRVSGTGMGYVYASFDNGEGGSLLAIKKVTQGFHDINFKVPYPTLHNFKIGISTTVPKGYTIDRLPSEDRYKLRTNSMMISQSTPMYESPGIGFAGLGATLNENISDPARGGQDSANNPYWDGNWDNFSWDNGFTGDQDVHCTNGESSPKVWGEYHGYYANRMSYSLAKFDSQDRFLGWDVIESQQFTMPAGVPVAIIMQFFVLPKKTDDGGDIAGAADREMLEPYWKYAHDYQVPASKMHLAASDWALCRGVKAPDTQDNRWDKNSRGVVNDVYRKWVTDTRYEGSGYNVGGKLYNIRELASKVEWYNESTKTWSAPSVAPQFIPKTNENGFTKIVFRIPRQLDPVSDKDRLDELNQYGVDYRYETTKNYFPYPLGPKKANGDMELRTPTDRCYFVLGRPSPNGQVLEYKEDGLTYLGSRKVRFEFFFQYGMHPYAGVADNDNGGPKPGWNDSPLPPIYFGDPEKMAKMNNPELLNAFYPVGGFKTGGVIVAIGRGIGGGKWVLSKSSTTDAQKIYGTNDPHPDGSKIGTRPSDVLAPKGVILTTDLEDDRVSVQEEGLLATWKAKFGEPLTAGFFSQYSFKDQIPEKPTHYRIKDADSGITIEAPYQIVYFEVGPGYEGPYADYQIVESTEKDKEGNDVKVTKLKINQPEGKPYALKPTDSLWLHNRTTYGKFVKQAIDIIDEVEEQRELMEAGLTEVEALVYNELDSPPEESTAAIAEIHQEEQRLRDQAILDGDYDEKFGDKKDEPKLPSGAKYIRSGSFIGDKWRINPKHYARESELKSAGLLGGFKNALSGFTNSRDFYVEDVTDKWGASGQPGLNGLGNVLDYVTPDSAEENLDQIISDAGYLAKAAVNTAGASAGAMYNVLNGDIDKATDKFDYIVDELTDQRPDYGDDDDVVKIAADLAWNVAAYGTSSAVEGGADLVKDITGLGGYSANGLGDAWDKAADVGEGVGKFVRGTARGLAPEALTEGIDEGVGALTDKFKANPVPYTLLAGGALIMVTPLGGFLARNLMTLAGGAIGLVPKALKAVPEGIGKGTSGVINGAREVGNSIVGNDPKPKSTGSHWGKQFNRKPRGTAKRRRNKRR